jgi:succinate dehydrogenase / fumarate reductase cytochrome b subunit
MSSNNRTRPLSPHLTIWRWGPHMAVSIMHRVTGSGMATVGAVLLVWWLVALAGGPAAYASFQDVFTWQSSDDFDLLNWALGVTYREGGLNLIGYLVGIGLTLSLFQHMASGFRHFFLDVGANYELKGNKLSAQATWGFAIVATVVFWVVLLMGAK